MSKKAVYLDVCVLCRPFDNQQQPRVRLETEALSLILSYLSTTTQYQLTVSPVHFAEIAAISNSEEREYLSMLLKTVGESPAINNMVARQRADNLHKHGLGIADAAHVAYAEQFRADFISVDDRLLKQCARMNLPIWSGSPIAYCEKENLR